MSNCRFCNKEIGGKTAGIHVMYCSLNPKRQDTINKIRNTIISKNKIKNPEVSKLSICKNCGKEFSYKVKKNSSFSRSCCSDFCSHSYASKFVDQSNKSLAMKTKSSWYKDGRSLVRIRCKTCNKEIGPNKYGYCQKHLSNSKDYHVHMSKSLKGKSGGWRARGGSGYRGYFCGYLYQSSWELAWITYNLNNEIEFERCTEHFPYNFNGKILKYYPDFKINGEYYEISGFTKEQKLAKINQFPKDKILHVLNLREIKPYLDYLKCAGLV